MLSLVTVAVFTTFCRASVDVLALPPVPNRLHSRDLQRRAEVDCGSFTMFCGGVPKPDGSRLTSIEPACANACHFVNVLNQGSYTATYRPNADTSQNRRQSGCQVGGANDHSICTFMPFSQRFADTENDPTCDEFPMADWIQPDFDPANGPRNSLRCMERGPNAAAGNQWKNFKEGVGDGLEGRICQGDMSDPNTDYKFTIKFNTDNADTSQIGYCSDPTGTLDIGEFWMTTMGGSTGANNFPMKSSDSHYSITDGTATKDLLQCKLVVTRTSGDNYDGTIFDLDGNEISQAADGLNEDGARLVIQPPTDKSLGDLAIIRTGEMGQGGTAGSRVDFEFRLKGGNASPLVDFDWNTETSGKDNRPSGSKYCDVPNIEDNEDGSRQTITCYYPCPLP